MPHLSSATWLDYSNYIWRSAVLQSSLICIFFPFSIISSNFCPVNYLSNPMTIILRLLEF
jgi:hypothetical protein